jgi:peptide-methionine (S)-S-oxide reductase
VCYNYNIFCSDERNEEINLETVYLAGGCLWGVQEFLKTLNGVIKTEAGRANGTSKTLEGEYDGYAECVKTVFDPNVISVSQLISCLFEIIDPYSLNKQGVDVGKKYRTGIYSENAQHLQQAQAYIQNRPDREKIMVEVLPLTNYIRSADEHQDRLTRCPEDYSYCHIPRALMYRHKAKTE